MNIPSPTSNHAVSPLMPQAVVEAAAVSQRDRNAARRGVAEVALPFAATGYRVATRNGLRCDKRKGGNRKRGQALLLAVLLMVLAALLGSTFITVVALNLSQSARFADKQQARQAAYYGISAVQKKIVDKGLDWRPDDADETAPPPARNDRTYYDEFDMAQGWAASGFIKYPDPRVLNGGGGPSFMVKVDKVNAGDPDNRAGDKTTDLRITIIGRSITNPSAFEKLVRYQPGIAKSPIGGAMRTVSNWDFQDKTVPVATVGLVSAAPASPIPPPNSNSITLGAVQGRFPSTAANGPYYVMIGDPRSSQAPRGAIVHSYAGSGAMVLSSVSTVVPVAGERIELASGLGAPLLIAYDNTNIPASNEKVDFSLSSDTAPTASSGGARINGGLLWFGDVRASNLRSSRSADYQNTVPSTLRSSGLMQVVNAPTSGTAVPAVAVAGSYSTGSGSAQLPAASRLAPNSADAAFPGNWSGMTQGQKAQLVDDGWNRLAGNQTAERQMKPFTPPDITRGANGDLSRYLQLSKFSAPANVNDSYESSLYGNGQGIYINNPEDKERWYDSNPDGDTTTNDGRVVEMPQARLREMWFNSPGSGGAYRRDGAPAIASNANASLEDQHLRGWIGPEEFRARGPLIELNADSPATITITLDSRDDSPAFNEGTASHKGWRDASGALLGDATVGGVYQKTFPWPANGVIFTEGNVRVRGEAPNAPRSLTIVSMNNAYIEGSLSAGATRKVLILARKNVVLNPTGVISRIDNQTRLSTPATVGATQIKVFDASGFRPGDFITFKDSSTVVGSARDPRIVSIAGNTITIDAPLTTARAALTTAVRTKADVLTTSTSPATEYNRLDDFSNVLQRRFTATADEVAAWASDTTNQGPRIAWKHNAQKIDAFRVAVMAGTAPNPTTAIMSNKMVANPQSTVIGFADKTLRVQHGTGTPDPDVFPLLPPTDNAAALAYKMQDLKASVDSRRISPNWRYIATILNGYEPTAPIQKPAYYFLASVGNRVRRVGDTSAFTAGTVDIVATNTFPIPMATSVVMAVNGLPATMRTTTASGYEEVRQFGFNPIHGVSSTDAAEALEDVLTSDQSFYSNVLAAPNSYLLDSRALASSNYQAGANSLQMRLNPLAENYFTGTGTVSTVPFIPDYRLARIKFENVSLNGTNDEVENLEPARTLNVNAFVYAQEGSWVVIPGDDFDDTARNSSTFNFNRDLNRDGVLSRNEQIAAYRYGRYNYQIKFTGAISENQTAIINDLTSTSGSTTTVVVQGEVADWMDKWSCVRINASNWNGAGATFRDNLAYNSNPIAPAINNFPNINYKFDDSVAKINFDSDGFQMPVAPGMMYGG